MKNIIDYLKERKNISFADDPFNEVDGLVLAEMSYADFRGVLDESSDEDIIDANEAFWKIHTDEEIMASDSYTKMAPFLMREMADSVRYKGTRLKNYVTDISLREIKQFGAVTVQLPDGTDFISYRGTNGTVAGWMEDFKFSFSTTEGQDDAVEYINRFHSSGETPIRTGGHSKGGNLAVYAAVKCEKSIQDRIIKVYSYDGPGFKNDILESDEYNRILPRILSVVPKDCMVGIMMNNRYNTIITDSDARSMYQHDAYQWHINCNRFEEIPDRSEFSYFFERSLNNWLIRCDESKRERILEIFFSLITDNDLAESDSTQLDSRFMHIILQNSSKLSRVDKTLLLSTLSDIIVSASVVTAEDLKIKSVEVADEVKEKSSTVIEEVKDKSSVVLEDVKEKSGTILEEVKIKSEPVIEKVMAESGTVIEEVKDKSSAVLDEIKLKSENVAEIIASKVRNGAPDEESGDDTLPDESLARE